MLNEDELKLLLRKYDVDFEGWGTGSAKSFEHLLKELNIGESKLIENEDGLIRVVSSIVMDVYYFKGDEKLKLVEDRQEYRDGRIVRRGLKNSLLEKIKPGEELIDGAKRALAEELGIFSDVEIIDKGYSHEIIMGKSYPGLMNEGHLYTYEVILPDQEFDPAGYKEIQEDKTNYFIWAEV